MHALLPQLYRCPANVAFHTGDGTLGVFASVMVHLYVDEVEALHARARAAGADVPDLELSPAGDRRFTAEDPEGQVWVFAQRVS